MSTYEIAGLTVNYSAKYDHLRKRSAKYRAAEPSSTPDISINVTDGRISGLLSRPNELTLEECEYMLTGQDFYTSLIDFNGMLLHASAVVFEGEAYLFSAPCGTGKSTHTSMWQRYFGADKAIIINDDKPAIRIINGELLAYGTPFSGKYDINENASAPIRGICFLYRSPKNTIGQLPQPKAIHALLNQSIRSSDFGTMQKLLATVGDILERVPVFSMGCNMNPDAVTTSYEAMKKGKVL